MMTKDTIVLLLIYSIIITYSYLKIKKQNKINYSNYQNALKALSSFDPKLADFLKKK